MKRTPGIIAAGLAALLSVSLLPQPAYSETVAKPVKPVTPQAKPVPVKPSATPGAALGSALPAKPANLKPAPALGIQAWSVSLTTDVTVLWPTQWATLTATANMDVGPTPYYLRILDTFNSVYVATCGFGTVCSAPVTQPQGVGAHYVAVVTLGSTSYPPSGVQATSNDVFIDWSFYITNLHLRLEAFPSTAEVGGPVTITASTAIDVGPSPFFIELIDVTARSIHGACPNGTICSSSAFVQTTETAHLYMAFLARSWTGYFDPVNQVWVDSEPIGTVAYSSPTYVTWATGGWAVELHSTILPNGTQTVTAVTNFDVGPTPYYIEIFPLRANSPIAVCGWGNTCSANFPQFSANTDSLQAFVTTYTPTIWPIPAGVTVKASSNMVNTLNS